jgi:hypothetical protein
VVSITLIRTTRTIPRTSKAKTLFEEISLGERLLLTKMRLVEKTGKETLHRVHETKLPANLNVAREFQRILVRVSMVLGPSQLGSHRDELLKPGLELLDAQKFVEAHHSFQNLPNLNGAEVGWLSRCFMDDGNESGKNIGRVISEIDFLSAGRRFRFLPSTKKHCLHDWAPTTHRSRADQEA